MDINKITVQLAPVQLGFSLNYHFTFQFGFRVCLEVCFLRWTVEETSQILDEQHHPAVQSQQPANKALDTNCIPLTNGTVGEHDDFHEDSNGQTTLYSCMWRNYIEIHSVNLASSVCLYCFPFRIKYEKNAYFHFSSNIP